jgi:hypothetical protein
VRLRHHYGRLDLGHRVAIRALVAFLITLTSAAGFFLRLFSLPDRLQ